MKNKKGITFTQGFTIALAIAVVIKIIAFSVIVMMPDYTDKSELEWFVVDVFRAYLVFPLLIDLLFPIMCCIKRNTLGKELSFVLFIISCMQIIFGVYICFLSIASIF